MWTFKSRSASDFGYVFYTLPFETEADARAKFSDAQVHAKKNGGAGSLHQDGEMVDQFSHWSPND